MKHILSAAATFLAVAALTLAIWYSLYPQPWDPKNPGYVLWKASLNPFENLDSAASALVFDGHRDELLIGRSEADIRRTFGELRPLGAAQPYLRECLATYGWTKQGKVYFIRNTLLAVIIRQGIVRAHVNAKSC